MTGQCVACGHACVLLFNMGGAARGSLLLQEYGAGRLAKKHSTFYASMMRALGLDAALEEHWDLLPWQVMQAVMAVSLLYPCSKKSTTPRYGGVVCAP